MAKPSAITRENIEKVAVLLEHREDGEPRMSVDEVREKLSVSPATVSRLKRRAIKDGLLRMRCELPDRRKKEIKQLFYANELIDSIRGWGGNSDRLQNIAIIESPSPRPAAANEGRSVAVDRQSTDEFAVGAAKYLLDDVLPIADSFGLTWGGTLQSIINQICPMLEATNVEQQKVFFPATGDPTQVNRHPELSATLLAARLDRAVNRSEYQKYSLGGVGAFIPEGKKGLKIRDEDRRKIILEYFRAVSSYGAIFDEGGLLERVDCILTSVGTTSRIHDPLLDSESVPKRHQVIKTATAGNIGGVFLERPGVSAPSRRQVQALNARWTGLKLEHFQQCAERALREKGAGVVVMATGDRAAIVAQAIREGVVSHLVVDQVLATGLSELCAAE